MYLTREKLEVSRVLNGRPCETANDGSETGASVLFLGIVRDHSESRSVLFLEYEAYEAMAEQMLRELVREAYRHWPIQEVRLVHRLGQVEVGEIAVAIEVRSAHRDEAYAASRFLIEEIKHNVPIWKKEYFADGTSTWRHCNVNVPRSA